MGWTPAQCDDITLDQWNRLNTDKTPDGDGSISISADMTPEERAVARDKLRKAAGIVNQ